MNISALADETLRHPFVETLGWALLHFVWQGAFVALLVCIVLLLMRRASANARYLVACGGLLVMAALPAVTMAMLPDRETSTGAVSNPREFAESPDQLPTHNPASAEVPIVSSSILPVDAFTIPVDSTDTGTPIESKSALAVSVPPPPLAKRCEMFLRPWLPLMIVVWLLGVVALAMRLLLTWVQVRRLETRGVLPTEPEHLRLMQQLATRLGVRRAVRLLESSLVEVPTVIGWLKPVILLPIASVNSLTVSQLEAILAHELAHIRRADYAVNLLQSLIETLLFYHPAVWWISSRIRQEREHCCDDLAASISGDTAGYVAALVRMEELRCEPRTVAVAARGGNLLNRVRRLLIPVAPEASFRDRVSPWWLTGAAALLIVGGLIGLPVLSKSQAEPVVVQETSRQPDHEKKPAKDAKENAANAKDRGVDVAPLADDDLDNITPSQIADRIEAAWKKYESIEYTATVAETRNTNSFAENGKPMLVKGTGSIQFRTDGTHWFADEKSFSYRIGTTDTYPIQKVSAFDGETHQVYDGHSLTLGQDEFAPNRFAAPGFFWQAGVSTDWLLNALRRPEAKLVEPVRVDETLCLHVAVKWKPDWDTGNRSFDILICPEQGWLPRRVIIERGGEMQAEWIISQVAKTESGLAYPTEFLTKRPTSDTNPRRRVTITSFRERTDFKPEEFIIAPQLGMDIVDHRAGFAWHNDPWWAELQPWMRESIGWPQANLQPLHFLHGYSEPELSGMDAPPIVAGDWLTEPAQLNWDRPERKVTVLHFYGGLLIEPSPQQLKALDHLQRRYRDGGLEVIGITTNDKSREKFRQAVKELNLSFPVMIDNKASDADIASKKTGAEWGATFVSYRLKAYTGTVVIDGDGKVQLVDANTQNLPNGMSHVESLVREALLKANGTADPPQRRPELINHASKMLRGTVASPNEIAAAISDRSPLWLQNAQQAIAASVPQAEQEFFKSHGATIELVLLDLRESEARMSQSAFWRLEEEWKRQAVAANGSGRIYGTVRKGGNNEFVSCSATLIVEPILRMLYSNSARGYTLTFDRSRTRKVDAGENGVFAVENLPMGTYQITVAARGKARVARFIDLSTHQSQEQLDIDLSLNDTISGKITNAVGDVIPNATIKAIKRFETPEHADLGRQTTEHLPTQSVSANASGEFVFKSLYEGFYMFEVTAEGYEWSITEPQPAGTTDLRVILKPKAQPDQANYPAVKSILGKATHQGQPVANAKIGLQAWSGPNGRYRTPEPFAATATTDDDGRYVLKVPAAVDDKSSIAIWAVADGFQPTRENIVLSLTDAVAALQNVELTPCEGSVIQLNSFDGMPLANANVTVPNQTLPRSIDFEIPKDWRDLVSGTTDSDGRVRLPYVVADAIAGALIFVPGHDGEIHVTENYFLNRKPAAVEPHYVWTLPNTGTLEGEIDAPPGTLPSELKLEVSTATAMPGDRPQFEWLQGVARPMVHANGRFRVISLAAGTVSIKPFLPADSPLQAEVPQKFVVIAGETTSITIPVTRGTHIRGRIVTSDTGSGLEGVKFSILYGASAREQKNMDDRIDITTDKDGRFDAWVPPGKILLRISWRDNKYGNAEWWSDRIDGLGSAFQIPDTEEFELEPIEFVPTGHVRGKVVDQDGKPLEGWHIFGYPEIPGKTIDTTMNCVAGTYVDDNGEFEGRFPITFPPVFWRVKRDRFSSAFDSDEDEYDAEVVSANPLALRVDTTPPVPTDSPATN